MAKSKKTDATQQAVAVANEPTTSRIHVVAVANLYKTKGAIDKAINDAKVSTINVMVEYQKIACSCIKHLLEHKDITVIRNLLDNWPEALRKVAISGFIDAYAPVKFEQDEATKKTIVHFSKERFSTQFNTEEVRAEKLESACGNAWYSMNGTKEPEYKPFNLYTMLTRVITQARNKFDKGIDESKGDYLPADAILQLEALAKKIKPSEGLKPVASDAVNTAEKVAA